MVKALLKITWLWLLGMVWIFSADQSTSQGIKQITERKAIPLPMYVDGLPQTTKIYSYLQPHLKIGMYQKKMKFHRDLPPTTVFAYGREKSTATFPGPTIEAIRHIPIHVTWENHLSDRHILPIDTTILTAMAPHGGVPTVVHLHGGAVEPDSDGSPFAWFTADFRDKGSAWAKRSYVYTNVQHSGNLIYHDHALGLTRVNLLAGLFGAYVIRDPGLEFRLNLPRGEEFDRHLIIGDRSFSTDGSIYMNPIGVNPDIHPAWRPEYYGDAITVNGKAWPYLTVKRRKYRFRIINASNARYYNLSLSNGVIPFTVVGSDGSYLSKPVKTSNIVVSVAEIFDVVVDFAEVEVNSLELLNSAPHPFPNGKVTAGLDSKVMKFVISPSPTIDWSTIPSKLVNYEKASRSDTTKTRYIAFYEYMNKTTHHSTHLYINGKRLTDPVTETPKKGSTELWHVINLTDDDHPLHLHVAVFQAIEARKMVGVETFKECMIGKGDPIKCNVDKVVVGERIQTPKHERTWKNVVKMAPWHMTSVIVKFKLVDSNVPYPFDVTKEPGYVYHCHILDHEDNEMIRPLKFIH